MRSLCGIEEVGAVESNPKPRPVRSIKIENCEVKVLTDTGATVNVMDECIFQQLLAKRLNCRNQQVFYARTKLTKTRPGH